MQLNQIYTLAGLVVYALTAISLLIRYGAQIMDRIRGLAGIRTENDLISWLLFLKCDTAAFLYRLRNYYFYPDNSNSYKYIVILLVFVPIAATVSFFLTEDYVSLISNNMFFIFMGASLMALMLIPLSSRKGKDITEIKSYLDDQYEKPRSDSLLKEFAEEVKRYSEWRASVSVYLTWIVLLLAIAFSALSSSTLNNGFQGEGLSYVVPDIIGLGFLIFVTFFWILTISLSREIDSSINGLFFFLWPAYVNLDLRLSLNKKLVRENGILTGMDKSKLILAKSDGYTSLIYIRNIMSISFIEKLKPDVNNEDE